MEKIFLSKKTKPKMVWGTVLSHKQDIEYRVLLHGGCEIDAVVAIKKIGFFNKVYPNDLVRVVFVPNAKIPKIIEVIHRLTITWNGEIIGYMENPNMENWFWFGKWVALSKPETKQFIDEIRNNEEAIVILGSTKGYVFTEPDDKIEIKIYPSSQNSDSENVNY